MKLLRSVVWLLTLIAAVRQPGTALPLRQSLPVATDVSIYWYDDAWTCRIPDLRNTSADTTARLDIDTVAGRPTTMTCSAADVMYQRPTLEGRTSEDRTTNRNR